jgi:adenine-specific DNA-methyltransferase
MDESELRALPKTRFYGSKRKHLSWMHQCIRGLRFNNALDVFGGTGSVTMLLESICGNVYYHDSAFFNFRQARAVFGKLSDDDALIVAKAIREIRPLSGFIAENFQGDYFLDDENRWLDGFIKMQSRLEEGLCRDALFYCVAQACLQKRPFNLFHRKNLHIRLNAKGQRFGNATTWAKSFSELSLSHLNSLLAYSNRERKGTVKVLTPRHPTKLNQGRDLVYVDPPYIRADRSTEGYPQRYHFIDGLSDPEAWMKSAMQVESSQYYASPAMTEPWGDKRSIEGLICKLLDRHKDSILVLSYMESGFPSVEKILDMFSSRFRRIQIHRRAVQRALSAATCAEILIVGEP